MIAAISLSLLPGTFSASEAVPDEAVAQNCKALAKNTDGGGYGPQAPRDIDSKAGENDRAFGAAPASVEMNLCNIHFHENAEHKGGDFTTFAGNGDGKGHGTGFAYDGKLTETEPAAFDRKVGVNDYGDLVPGDTIEVHYVYSSAKVVPGETLNACLTEAMNDPQLRVEAQVYVLVNDRATLGHQIGRFFFILWISAKVAPRAARASANRGPPLIPTYLPAHQ